MTKIPFEQFNTVHLNFKGDTQLTNSVCHECQGKCEYNKVSSLLPGEAEYMAFKLGMPVEIFRDKYLDGVFIEGETIDLLKCSDPCPFLQPDFSCRVKYIKPILCLIYPILFQPGENDKWEIIVDKECPLAHNKSVSHFFKNEGQKILDEMNIPPEWLKRMYMVDEYDYDYEALVIKRETPMGKYKTFKLNELLSYRKICICIDSNNKIQN